MGTFKDASGVNSIELNSTQAKAARINSTLDTTGARLIAWDLDLNASTLTLTFNEVIKVRSNIPQQLCYCSLGVPISTAMQQQGNRDVCIWLALLINNAFRVLACAVGFTKDCVYFLDIRQSAHLLECRFAIFVFQLQGCRYCHICC